MNQILCFFLRPRLILLVLVTILVPGSSADHNSGFLHTPNQILYGEEGRNLTVNWKFHLESRVQTSGIKDFLFGEWADPGYIKFKILYLNPQHIVKARPGYLDKVHYEVDIFGCANCSANVTICKLTSGDFKKYGIDILVGLHRSPLQHSFELRAPPRITMFSRNLSVPHGNKTTIRCMAKGIPLPLVKIQKNKRALCNGTLSCQYTIERVDIEDQGEYECIAEQGERSDNSSTRLMVLRKDDHDDLQRTSETSNTLIIALATTTAVIIAIVCAVLYRRLRKNNHKFENVKGNDEAFKTDCNVI